MLLLVIATIGRRPTPSHWLWRSLSVSVFLTVRITVGGRVTLSHLFNVGSYWTLPGYFFSWLPSTRRLPASSLTRSTAEECAAKEMGDGTGHLSIGTGHMVKLPNFADSAPKSLKKLMEKDPSVAQYINNTAKND